MTWKHLRELIRLRLLMSPCTCKIASGGAQMLFGNMGNSTRAIGTAGHMGNPCTWSISRSDRYAAPKAGATATNQAAAALNAPITKD
jgi:hypothetical protein